MKTLNNISKNNLFVIVRNSGINVDIMVTDAKNLGAHAAAMYFGPKCGTRFYNTIVTDIPKDKLKVMGLLQTKAYENRYYISINNEKYKHIMDIANTNGNQYDIQECIDSYKFSSFHLFMFRRDNEYFFMKANDPFAATAYLKNQGFEIIDTQRIEDQTIASYFSMYERFTGKENENQIRYNTITKKMNDQIHFGLMVNKMNK